MPGNRPSGAVSSRLRADAARFTPRAPGLVARRCWLFFPTARAPASSASGTKLRTGQRSSAGTATCWKPPDSRQEDRAEGVKCAHLQANQPLGPPPQGARRDSYCRPGSWVCLQQILVRGSLAGACSFVSSRANIPGQAAAQWGLRYVLCMAKDDYAKQGSDRCHTPPTPGARSGP